MCTNNSNTEDFLSSSSSSSLSLCNNNASSSSPLSLLTLTSIVVSRTYPFELIEQRYKNIIPEPVQKSIIYHSFPKHESEIIVYACNEFSSERYGVDQVVQIGFHLSGLVTEISSSSSGGSNGGSSSKKKRSGSRNKGGDDDEDGGGGGTSWRVSVTFDRGKITGVNCECENEQLIFWCDHVVALALHRIRNCVQGVDFVLRVPISETLLQLNRSQLQKLVQYLISDHTDVLPTAQRLADEILFMKTDDNFINRIHGAPDPTAGPSPTDPHSWALNEQNIQIQVRVYLQSHGTNSLTCTNSAQAQQQQPHQHVIQMLIERIYKMLYSKDSNAERIIQIITNELVRYATKNNTNNSNNNTPSTSTSTTRSSSSSNHSLVWDQIVRLWNILVLKPNMSVLEYEKFNSVLTKLSEHQFLPESEDYYVATTCSKQTQQQEELDETEHEETNPSSKKPRKSHVVTVFTTPLNLLHGNYPHHDYEIMKLHSHAVHGINVKLQAIGLLDSLRNSVNQDVQLENAYLLFEILKDTYPREAYETALIGLSAHRVLKNCAYVHEKYVKTYEKFISKINCMVFKDLIVSYGKKLCSSEYDVNNNSFPIISFAIYLFNTLVKIDQDDNLAYKIALKYLQINENTYVHTHLEAQQISLSSILLTNYVNKISYLDEISCAIIKNIHSNTSLFRLAQEVFKHANHENLVLVSFKLALHVVRATKQVVHRRRWEMVRWVVSCGVEIGVSKLFHLVEHWGEYFSAVEAVGTVASNILSVIGSCGSGSGGSSSSSSTVGGSNSTNSIIGNRGLKNLDKRVCDELGSAARNLAIQCAKNDPQNCALNTLTLCENDPVAFDTSYQIVLDSASKEFLTPQQIFTIARYMEHRGYTQRAYRLAVIALQFVHIGYNQDTHSLISEIHWTCNLSHQLSTPSITNTQKSSSSYNNKLSQQQAPQPRYNNPLQQQSSSSCSIVQQQHHHHAQAPPQPPLTTTNTSSSSSSTELENLIPLLIRNIKCATVLTEILRRSITIMTSYENAYQKEHSRSSRKSKSSRVYEKLSLLIEGTIDSYITTTHSRLVHISPRHYSDFIEFLSKARENFMLAPNGCDRFKHLVESMKVSYKGKKKLLFLLTERFG